MTSASRRAAPDLNAREALAAKRRAFAGLLVALTTHRDGKAEWSDVESAQVIYEEAVIANSMAQHGRIVRGAE
jgi:hypothetical protein